MSATRDAVNGLRMVRSDMPVLGQGVLPGVMETLGKEVSPNKRMLQNGKPRCEDRKTDGDAQGSNRMSLIRFFQPLMNRRWEG